MNFVLNKVTTIMPGYDPLDEANYGVVEGVEWDVVIVKMMDGSQSRMFREGFRRGSFRVRKRMF